MLENTGSPSFPLFTSFCSRRTDRIKTLPLDEQHLQPADVQGALGLDLHGIVAALDVSGNVLLGRLLAGVETGQAAVDKQAALLAVHRVDKIEAHENALGIILHRFELLFAEVEEEDREVNLLELGLDGDVRNEVISALDAHDELVLAAEA